MIHVDGIIIPVPKKKFAAYRAMSKKFGKVCREHGALEYNESVADDVKKKKTDVISARRQTQSWRDRRICLGGLKIARCARPRHGKDHEAQTGGRDDEPEVRAGRRQTPDFRRLQNLHQPVVPGCSSTRGQKKGTGKRECQHDHDSRL